MITSYAQELEDVVLYRALHSVQKGFCIDVGAQHPVHDSVTKTFSELGWRGINIEPVSEWFIELVKDRPNDINLNVAAYSFDGVVVLHQVIGTGLSTTVKDFANRAHEFPQITINVPCRKLSGICAQYVTGDIHFLKIDVEGAERSVIEGWDFERFRPWIIVVEATEPRTAVANYGTWEPILVRARYNFALFDGLNRFYVATEKPELKPALVFPADDYTRAAEILTRAALEDTNLQMKKRITALEAEINRMRSTR